MPAFASRRRAAAPGTHAGDHAPRSDVDQRAGPQSAARSSSSTARCLNVGSFDELGGLDIESVEVVKGAAGASIYGATAANGVIVIKTKRGANQDGVKFTRRTEYGFSDLNSFDYGMPINHSDAARRDGHALLRRPAPAPSSPLLAHGELDVGSDAHQQRRDGHGAHAASVSSSASPAAATLVNVFQAQHLAGPVLQHDGADVVAGRPSRSTRSTRRAASAAFASTPAAPTRTTRARSSSSTGQQQRRGPRQPRLRRPQQRERLDQHDVRPRHDGPARRQLRQLLRGATPGTDYLARDTLGRPILLGFGAGLASDRQRSAASSTTRKTRSGIASRIASSAA